MQPLYRIPFGTVVTTYDNNGLPKQTRPTSDKCGQNGLTSEQNSCCKLVCVKLFDTEPPTWARSADPFRAKGRGLRVPKSMERERRRKLRLARHEPRDVSFSEPLM